MKDGFIKVAAATCKVKVADCIYNRLEIEKMAIQAALSGAKLIVFPELSITAYTCADLFFQETLLNNAEEQLLLLAENLKGYDIAVIVGLPLQNNGKLYNCAAVLKNGEVLGIIPKSHIPNYGEFYESRYFTPAPAQNSTITLNEKQVPFGAYLLFCAECIPEFVFTAEICEDLWVTIPPSSYHTAAGATVIANLSASDEVVGKEQYRKELVTSQSGRGVCAYLYADAGEGESTTDLVFSGHNMIAEDDTLLAQSNSFSTGITYAQIDVKKLVAERRRLNTFTSVEDSRYLKISVHFALTEFPLERQFSPTPFVPNHLEMRNKRCEEILSIQCMGLKKRMEHTNAETAIIGVSGGLDSTLAILVTAHTFDLMQKDRAHIIGVTMPCFGTTDRTYQNARTLMKGLKITIREIPIKDSVLQHFQDIGHDADDLNVTYENAQARERTQVIMDIANQENGLVVGTGDLSELALGWATYNGDHMSMYGVNASVPKTLVRFLVEYAASKDNTVSEVLYDILNTPVSPELLPAENGQIAQKTEKIVGPYEVHDFVLYYMLRFGFPPRKILRMALSAFQEKYSREDLLNWMKLFYRRFFTQQFKRSCLPDGPKIGSVSLSPRGDFHMPSDAVYNIWLNEVESLK